MTHRGERHPVTAGPRPHACDRVEQQIRAFSKLHASELQLILDELSDIAKQLEEEKAAASAPAEPTAPVDPADPAASSPKRAKWLAEQERKPRPNHVASCCSGSAKETYRRRSADPLPQPSRVSGGAASPVEPDGELEPDGQEREDAEDDELRRDLERQDGSRWATSAFA